MPIEFSEQQLPDGRLVINWQAPTPRDWQRILTLIKTRIPVNGRTYLKDQKAWLIAGQYRPVYEEIKSIVLNGDPESLDDVDQQINDEALVELVDRDILRLPASMRRRALFAVKATVGLIDTPVEFCVSEGIFGAWNPDENTWCYENGRYSHSSPTERDNKARDRAYKRIARIIKEFNSQLETIDEISELYWKVKFRAEMLAKYEYRCYICNQHPQDIRHLHMHRVIPGKDNGQYVDENVVILCVSCHRKFEGATWEVIKEAHESAAE